MHVAVVLFKDLATGYTHSQLALLYLVASYLEPVTYKIVFYSLTTCRLLIDGYFDADCFIRVYQHYSSYLQLHFTLIPSGVLFS